MDATIGLDIEITPEMITAGAAVIQEHHEEHSSAWLAKEVFRAMLALATRRDQNPVVRQ